MAQTIKAASQYAHNYAKNLFASPFSFMQSFTYFQWNFFSENIYHVGYVKVNVHILIERSSIFLLNQVMVSELHAKPSANSDWVNE